MNNHTAGLLALAALFADSVVPSRSVNIIGNEHPRNWRPRFGARHARGPLPPSKRDYLAEAAKLDGRAFRHRFTGQARLFLVSAPRQVVYAYVFGPGGSHKSFDRDPRKVLAWVRNAVEVPA